MNSRGFQRLALILAVFGLMCVSWVSTGMQARIGWRVAALVCAVWLYKVVQHTEEEKRLELERTVRELRVITESLTLQNDRLVLANQSLESDTVPEAPNQAVLSLYRSLANTVSRQDVADIFLRRLKDAVGYVAGAVFLFDEDRTRLTVEGVWGLYQDEIRNQVSSEHGLPAQVAGSGQPLIASDASQDPRLSRLWSDLRSAVYLPIRLNRETFGTVCLWSDQTGAFTAETERQLGPMTVEAARAFKNAELHEEKEKRLTFLMKLWEISRNLTQSVDPAPEHIDRVLDDALAELAFVFGADAGMLLVWRPEERSLVPRRVRGMTEAFAGPLADAINRSGLLVQGSSQMRDVSRDPRLSAAAGSFKSMLWGPLSGRRATVGALMLCTGHVRTWSPDELRWLDIFSKVISIAMENISLFHDLAGEKNQLQILVDNMPEGVFTTDRQGRVLTWNEAGEKITGWTADEIIGRSCAAFLQCQTVDLVWCASQCPLRVAMDGQKRYDSGLASVFVVTRTGEKIPVFITSAPITDESGAITGSILVFRDITKEKEIEQVKEDFLATITHDLKSPLASIMGYTELLRNPRVGPVSDTQIEFLEAIARSSKTLQILIDNILESTRMESGQMVYNQAPFGLQGLMDEVREMFLPLISPKQLKLEFSVAGDLQVFGDREKLKEVFVNLLSNSVKFTRDHGSIKVRAQHEADTELVRIQIEDSGKGIAPDQLHRLFLKFSQVKGERGGTGLGLYIVKKILEAHGQTVRVTSTPGVGTTFIFTLPLFVALKPPGSSSTPLQPARTQPTVI